MIIKNRSKYGSKKSGGYDSAKEKRRADILKLLNEKGVISELKEQVAFTLLPKQEVIGFNGKVICGRRSMHYICDFTYLENGVLIVEDVKGFRTAEYIKKANLMRKIHGIIIRET